MDKLEEIKLRDAGCNLECPSPTNWPQYYRGSEDRRWLLGEVERLRGGLESYANKDNWSVEETDIGITYIDWMGEHRKKPWEIARRVLAGEE